MNGDTSLTQPGMIITDDFALNPILNFDAYRDAIVKMIMESHPKFSIGIYGEWGTGKTTLMKRVEDKLKERSDNNILTVWFNAWRYEREDQFAITALLKTIGYAMGEHPIYKELKPILLRAVKIITKGFLSEIASKYIGEKGVEEFKTNLLPKMDVLSELDKDTIYFDGIYKIENEMRRIIKEYPLSRVVVFIDDLDRCSPKKALEVFESIKVFLGLEGFVYVVGLSHLTISKLITAQYKESEVKGEQYIRKIIQIPITLPEWNTKGVVSLIEHFLNQNLINDNYRQIIKNNSKLISEVVENNPREVKRFINNYIVAYEIHSSLKRLDATQLLLVQALGVRWSIFYRTLVRSSKEFRLEVSKYAEMTDDTRIEQLDSDKIEEGFTKQTKNKLQEFKAENELWQFLKQHKRNILEVEDLQNYIEAAESVKEITTAAQENITDIEFRKELRLMLDSTDNCLKNLRKELVGVAPIWRDEGAGYRTDQVELVVDTIGSLRTGMLGAVFDEKHIPQYSQADVMMGIRRIRNDIIKIRGLLDNITIQNSKISKRIREDYVRLESIEKDISIRFLKEAQSKKSPKRTKQNEMLNY